MRAQLFIKGEREPIELEEVEARAANALILDTSRPDSTPFSIEGVWTGKKGDMKYVKFPKASTTEAVPHDSWEPMEKAEADAFYAEIKKFISIAEARTGKRYNWYPLMLESLGIFRLEIEKTPEGKEVIVHEFSKDRDKWEEFSHKLNRFNKYQEYAAKAEQEKLKQLDEIAKQAEHVE